MFELAVQGDIAAAHYLPGYQGKCKDLHGHTWKVEVTLVGDQLDEIGMVADFAFLKKSLKGFLSELDHKCLNDLECFCDCNPTTENIARYIYQGFGRTIAPLKLTRVRVWESPLASVTYYE